MQLKEVRIQAGMTQVMLANKIGVKQPTICHIENGELFPSPIQQIQINEAVKYNINWQEHPSAPLTNREERMLTQLYDLGVSIFGSEKECSEFLSVQSNGSLRKMFKLARVDKVVEPMKANGYPVLKRRK